jgi:Transposase DDE domain
VRRITLRRSEEEGDVILLSSLLDAKTYPAEDIMDAYLMRWGIETCFQRVTEVFNLRNLIGGTPQATVFQAAFCLLLYNVVMVMRGYLAEAKKLEPEKISPEEVFADVQGELIAWNKVIKVEETVVLLAGQTEEKIKQRLRVLLGSVWSDRWLMTPSRERRPIQKQTEYLEGGHNSVFRLLEKAKQLQSFP